MDSLFVPLLIGCVVAIASALGVILARRPVYAAVFLLLHSLSLAALYGVLSQAMVAIGQVIIYLVAIVGAVVIWRRHEPRPRTVPPAKVSEPRQLVMHR